MPELLWVAFGALTLGFSVLVLSILERRKQKRRYEEWEFNNPTLSGPPVVEGGVGAVPQQERYSRIVAELATTATMSAPGTIPSEWRVVGDIVRGHLVDCEGMVRYREGTEPALRHFNNEPAFRALMEHTPTGERHQKYVLWACMNGCWLNMVEGTLNFVPDTSESGRTITLSPIVLAEEGDIAKYGEPLYDPRHDRLALLIGREEAVDHAIADLPRRRGHIFIS